MNRFIIIGADKCGTTSSTFHLNIHPDIFMYSDRRYNEINFFDNDKTYEKGIEWYESLFPKNKKIIGEKTPAYLFLKYAIDRINTHYPDIKIIIYLREPVSRAYSRYNSDLLFNITNENFRSLIKKDKQRPILIDLSIDQQHNLYKNFDNKIYNLQRGFYIDYIEYVYSLFPKENIYIAINEEIKENPLIEYNKIYQFLGGRELLKNEFIFDTTINKLEYKKSISKEDFNYVYKIYKPYNERLYEFIGRRIKLWEDKYVKMG